MALETEKIFGDVRSTKEQHKRLPSEIRDPTYDVLTETKDVVGKYLSLASSHDLEKPLEFMIKNDPNSGAYVAVMHECIGFLKEFANNKHKLEEYSNSDKYGNLSDVIEFGINNLDYAADALERGIGDTRDTFEQIFRVVRAVHAIYSTENRFKIEREHSCRKDIKSLLESLK